jgi:hypothetical protein
MNNNFHIFIASCFESLDIQVPRLINNIIEMKIPCNYVHFIVGGCPDEKIYYINNIQIINVKYRCFEFTPHIFIINNPDFFNFDYAFFTHDTVKFGINFYDIIKNDILYCKNNNFDTMKIENPAHSMNIGIYSKDIILKNKNILSLLSLNSNNYNDLYELKKNLCHFEDFILLQNNYYNSSNISDNVETNFTSINGVITKGLIRYFKRIDFIKYQNNFNGIKSIDICKLDLLKTE